MMRWNDYGGSEEKRIENEDLTLERRDDSSRFGVGRSERQTAG